MRLLADENFPGAAVEGLRRRGHDVAWVRTEMPGLGDEGVLLRAAAEGRILLTFDKDFGELAFKKGLPAPCGIVLFRISPASPSLIARLAIEVLEARADWSGHFAVVEEDRVRMIPLSPKAPPSP